MKKLFILILIFLSSYQINAQLSTNKVGGVGFRIDDSQYYPEYRLIPLVNVFNQRGLKFTYAVNFGIYISPALLAYLPTMQSQGYEIADHTPDHQTRYFDVPLSDIPFYQGRAGVDHIYNVFNNSSVVNTTVGRVCMKVDRVKTDTWTGEGNVNISGNTIISVTPNEFTTNKVSSSSDPYSMNVLYIPEINQLFKFDPLNVSGNTITNIKSFWDEDVNITTLNNVQYHKIKLYDVFYVPDAHRVMAERVQRMCDANGIQRPTSWIQPGGYHPQFYRADIKEALEPMGYTTAGVFADPFPPYYNSYDPNDDHRYGINWEDFNEEFQTLAQSKKIIADRFAKHYVSIGHSHLLSYNPSADFNAYLQRTADILDWCIQKGIPVKTYEEWKEQLFRTPQNPYVNVMPNIDVDLDGDGYPDGYNSWSIPGLSDDGVAGIFSKSIVRTGNGTMFSLQDLGGVEKGDNYFEIWIKGVGEINIQFNPNLWQSITFTSTNNNWQKYNCTFQMPTTSSDVDAIVVSSQNTSGSIKIGGLVLRKNYPGSILPPFLNRPQFTLSNNSVQLQWADNSNNENGFRVKRKFQIQNNWVTINNNLPANSTSWADNLLDFPDALRSYDSITVYYQIEAFGGNNNSPGNIDSIRIKTEEALPVELSSFKANFKGNKIQLLWRTETEVNNYGFEIQRKQTGNSKGTDTWEKIGFVQGYGNSNSPKEYSFLDEKPFCGNKNLYRLKQIDNDGQFAYSDEVEVDILPSIFALEQNYPNPFNPVTKIRYQIPQKENVTLKIFNSLGEEVKTLLDESKEPGYYEIEFNGENLSSGIYFYRMQSGTNISTKKMVIIK